MGSDTIRNILALSNCIAHPISGDGVIDEEEFVYVLTDFGVRERFSRQAWKMFTQVTYDQLSYLAMNPTAYRDFGE